MADQNRWRKNIPEDFQGKMADKWDGEIPLKPIFWSTFSIALAVFIAFVFNIWLMDTWDGYRASQVRVSPLAEAQERLVHVDPKLQPSPEAELTEMKEEQEEHMASYGWIDPLERRVHIPVERAMEIVIDEKGTAAPGSIEPAPAPVDVEAAAEMDAGEMAPAADGNSAAAADPASEEHSDAGDH